MQKASGRASDLLPEGFTGKKFFRNISLSSRQRYLDNISYFTPGKLHKLLTPEFYEAVSVDREAEAIMMKHFEGGPNEPWLSQLQYLDTKTYLPADVMTKVDRMSMAHSLEAREPLLDHVLYEYVAKLPVNMKFRDGVSKYLSAKWQESICRKKFLSAKNKDLEFHWNSGLKAI